MIHSLFLQMLLQSPDQQSSVNLIQQERVMCLVRAVQRRHFNDDCQAEVQLRSMQKWHGQPFSNIQDNLIESSNSGKPFYECQSFCRQRKDPAWDKLVAYEM